MCVCVICVCVCVYVSMCYCILLCHLVLHYVILYSIDSITLSYLKGRNKHEQRGMIDIQDCLCYFWVFHVPQKGGEHRPAVKSRLNGTGSKGHGGGKRVWKLNMNKDRLEHRDIQNCLVHVGHI